MGRTANMFDRLKSLMDRGGKIDAPAEPERRFIMPQGKIQPAASKPAAAASLTRFKGSRSTDNVHARDIQDSSEEHTAELQSLMRHSYPVIRWEKKRHIR